MGGYGDYSRDELEEFNVAQLLEDNRKLKSENARLRAALDAIERAVKGVVRQ